MKSGIYKIYCKETNKYYVGQSVNIENRLKQHLGELKNNKHQNKMLQDDFNKFKEDAFVFEPIKYIEEQYLNIMEGYFIDLYDSLKDGYNIQDVIERVRKKERSKMEIRKQIECFRNLESIDININKRELALITLYYIGFFFEQYYGWEGYSEKEESLITGSDFSNELFSKLFGWNKKAVQFSSTINDNILKQIKKKFHLIEFSELYIDYPDKNEEGNFEQELKNIINLVSKNELYCLCDYKDESGEIITRHIKLKIHDSESIIHSENDLVNLPVS